MSIAGTEVSLEQLLNIYPIFVTLLVFMFGIEVIMEQL